MALKKSNANLFSVWNISSGKTVLPLQMFRCSPDYRSTLMVQFCYLRLYLGIQTVFCRLFTTSYRWQGWTWIENWKSWANVFQVLIFCPQKSTKTLLWLLLPDGIWLIFNSSYNLVPGSVLGEKAKKRSELNRGLGRVKGRRTFFSPHRTARLASLADRRPPFFSSSFSPTVRSLLPGYSS